MAVIATPKRWAWAALCASSFALLGCSTRFADAIVREDVADPCTMLTATDCAADTADGCSLQPNPTGCLSSDASCGAGQCRGGDPFVRRSGEALFLHGAPFNFMGTVSWWLAWDDDGCKIGAYSSQENALGPSFDDLARMHVSVLRFWAYQSYAGASGTDYSHFDKVVAQARAAGVRLIPVLENMHPDCSASPARDDAWFADGYKSPYGNYALSYRDYVAGLVAHFSDEPTIMAWELFHEAGADQFAVLDAFAQDMTSVIRAQDDNHRIALGLNDGDGGGTSSDGDDSNYFKLQDRTDVDLIDVHDFSTPNEPMPKQVARCRAIAHTLAKPIFVGAGASELTDTQPASFSTRADQMRRKLEAAQADAFSGYLVYDFVPGWQSASNDFDSRPEEPLAGPNGVLDQHAPRY
jgi:mannan endo-1,4-beta-mannosidase